VLSFCGRRDAIGARSDKLNDLDMRILGLSPQAGSNWVDSNTVHLPANGFGLLAAIGPILRQFQWYQRCVPMTM